MGKFKSLKSIKTPLMIFALMGLLILQFQNCSTYSDPSLFDVDKAMSASQSGPTDIRLDSPAGILDVPERDLALSFGGECNVGLSAKHFIEVRLNDANNNPMPVRIDNMCPEGNAVHHDCFRAVQFRCEHGRYYVHLPITCRTAFRNQPQSVYRITGQLVTFDANGLEIRDNKATFERFFTISWNQGDCGGIPQ